MCLYVYVHTYLHMYIYMYTFFHLHLNREAGRPQALQVTTLVSSVRWLKWLTDYDTVINLLSSEFFPGKTT